MLDKRIICKRVISTTNPCEVKVVNNNFNFKSLPPPSIHNYSSPCTFCPLRGVESGRRRKAVTAAAACPFQKICPILHQPIAFHYSTASSKPHQKCLYCLENLQNDNELYMIKCQSCKLVQPREHLQLSLFDLFNDGKVTFNIDLVHVRKRFLQLQRHLHPDQFCGKEGGGEGEEEGEASKANEWSAYINRGYETLRSNSSRAIYMYNLFSTISYDEETCGSTLSQDELMEILEIRESLEDCQTPADSGKVLNDSRERVNLILCSLTGAFSKGDLNSAKHQIDRLKFLNSIIEAAETKHQALLVGRG